MGNCILSICIPIYNRSAFLDRMLTRFLKDRLLFDEKIQLFISDNCSTDDLLSVCSKYRELGLNLEYCRNATNLGMDGNFINCFRKASGKYVWVLGSDDIPADDIIERIVSVLESNDVASVHLENTIYNTGITLYNNVIEYLKEINIYITYLSGNIISTACIKEFNFEKYKGTFISQVPVYLTTMLCGKDNLLFKYKFLQDGNDSSNNGGYNFFQVFMVNYFTIWEEFVRRGAISRKDYEYIKRVTFERFHLDYVFRTLIDQPSQALDMSGCKEITFRYFGGYLYLYTNLIKKYKEYYWHNFRYKVHVLRLKLLEGLGKHL